MALIRFNSGLYLQRLGLRVSKLCYVEAVLELRLVSLVYWGNRRSVVEWTLSCLVVVVDTV